MSMIHAVRLEGLYALTDTYTTLAWSKKKKAQTLHDNQHAIVD